MNTSDTPRPALADARLEALARRRARAKLGWFLHAAVYVAVNVGLVALSLAHQRHWAVYPLLGWGLGLALHGAAVWMLAPGGQLFESLVARERRHLGATAPRQGDRW